MKPDYALLAEAYSAVKAAAHRRELDPEACHEFDKAWPILSDAQAAAKAFAPTLRCMEQSGVTIASSRVLELGHGGAALPISLVFCGATECVALRSTPAKLGALRAFARMLPYGLAERLRVVEGWDEATPGGQAFDIVFCNGLLSQPAGRELLPRLRGVLAPKGCLLISEEHNARNPLLRYKLHNLYRWREEGPPGRRWGEVIEKTYRQLRAEIVARSFGTRLSRHEAHLLAERTSGLHGETLLEACERYIKKGEPPQSFYVPDTAPVDPTTGATWEQLTDPVELRRRLQREGYRRCKIHPCLPGASRFAAMQWLERALPLWLKLPLSATFMISAFP